MSLISSSGGWGAIPNGGPMIFNGNSVHQGGGGGGVGGAARTPVGSFKVSSRGVARDADGSRTTVSYTCRVGWAANTGGTAGLAMCVEFEEGTSVGKLISTLQSLAGLSGFSIPRVKGNLNDSVWLKEGQSAYGMIMEMAAAAGCVIYDTGGGVRCAPVTTLIGGGGGGGDVLEATSLVTAVAAPSGVVINGSSKFKSEPRQSLSHTHTALVASSYSGGQNLVTVITDIKEEMNDESRTYIKTQVVSSEDPHLNSHLLINEQYEQKPKRGGTTAYDVESCYPNDTARILSRTTSFSDSRAKWAHTAISEFIGSLQLSDADEIDRWGIAEEMLEAGGLMLLETSSENWTYNTLDYNITFGSEPKEPGGEESASYNKTSYKARIAISSQFASASAGGFMPFLGDKKYAKDYGNIMYGTCVDSYDEMLGYISEKKYWTKESGISRWAGTRTSYANIMVIDGNFIGARMRAHCKRLKDGKAKLSEFFTSCISKRMELQGEASGSITHETETRMDWSPDGGRFPGMEFAFERPYVIRHSLPGTGGVISANPGAYMDAEAALAGAKDTAALTMAKGRTTTMTILNRLFRPGDCDSPSFSVDVNGVKGSGVFFSS